MKKLITYWIPFGIMFIPLFVWYFLKFSAQYLFKWGTPKVTQK